MPRFIERCNLPELLDGTGYSKEELFRNLREIDFVNRLLGGHQTTLSGLKVLLKQPVKPVVLADFGCGSGDTLKYVSRWLKKRGILSRLYGIDNNPWTCEYARKNCEAYKNIEIIEMDFRDIHKVPEPIQIGISTLFCHHLHGEMLSSYIQLMNKVCTSGFVINDLHRHPLPYHLIRFLSVIFNGSQMLRNDAPLSVQRGFKKNELVSLLKLCGVKKFTVEWKWAFRYLVVGSANE